MATKIENKGLGGGIFADGFHEVVEELGLAGAAIVKVARVLPEFCVFRPVGEPVDEVVAPLSPQYCSRRPEHGEKDDDDGGGRGGGGGAHHLASGAAEISVHRCAGEVCRRGASGRDALFKAGGVLLLPVFVAQLMQGKGKVVSSLRSNDLPSGYSCGCCLPIREKGTGEPGAEGGYEGEAGHCSRIEGEGLTLSDLGLLWAPTWRR